jgi:hypothetical protein
MKRLASILPPSKFATVKLLQSPEHREIAATKVRRDRRLMMVRDTGFEPVTLPCQGESTPWNIFALLVLRLHTGPCKYQKCDSAAVLPQHKAEWK